MGALEWGFDETVVGLHHARLGNSFLAVERENAAEAQ